MCETGFPLNSGENNSNRKLTFRWFSANNLKIHQKIAWMPARTPPTTFFWTGKNSFLNMRREKFGKSSFLNMSMTKSG